MTCDVYILRGGCAMAIGTARGYHPRAVTTTSGKLPKLTSEITYTKPVTYPDRPSGRGPGGGQEQCGWTYVETWHSAPQAGQYRNHKKSQKKKAGECIHCSVSELPSPLKIVN